MYSMNLGRITEGLLLNSTPPNTLTAARGLAALVGVLCVLALGGGMAGAQTAGLQRLKVSPDGHSMVKEDWTPFFWMGDTGWFIRAIPPDDVELYLSNRVKNGFIVIQTGLGFKRLDYARKSALSEQQYGHAQRGVLPEL